MMHSVSPSAPRAVVWLSGWALLVGCLTLGPCVHAGPTYRWVDAQGQIHLTDTPPPSGRDRTDSKVYSQGAPAPASEPRATPTVDTRGTPPPSAKPSGVVVDAELNRRLTVPLRLDLEAELTVLPKPVAEALGLTALDQWPTHTFNTTDGMVTGPVTSLRSLRIGGVEARDVNVAIDTQGRLAVGLLGQSFARRFTVTVDQARGQVTFAR
jgi:hypothetical protein